MAGTAAGRFFRVASIDKVGAPVASAIGNLAPLVATGLAVAMLGEQVTFAILAGTLVIVAGTVLLSLSGKHVGFPARYLIYPFMAAWCFGMVQVVRKMGLSDTGPLFDAAINITAAMVASTAFVAASGKLQAAALRPPIVRVLRGGRRLRELRRAAGDRGAGVRRRQRREPALGDRRRCSCCCWRSSSRAASKKLGWRVALGTMLIVLGVVLLTVLKTS